MVTEIWHEDTGVIGLKKRLKKGLTERMAAIEFMGLC